MNKLCNKGVFAAVMCGPAIGAISTVQLFGSDANMLLGELFFPMGGNPMPAKIGEVRTGPLMDGDTIVDQITVGCESENNYALCVHGNPLLVETVMNLLVTNGAQIITAEQMLEKTLRSQGLNTIQIESKLAQAKAKTLLGTKILEHQADDGFAAILETWRNEPKNLTNQIEQIEKTSNIAQRIIFGARIVLAGEPNTGKSTLLNTLAGAEKAIVTDIRGTTRDWVSAHCQSGDLCMEIIDTAGLDSTLIAGDNAQIDAQSQQRAREFLETANLILLVLDASRESSQSPKELIDVLSSKKMIVVLNKCDLEKKLSLDNCEISEDVESVEISAEQNIGIDELLDTIQQTLETKHFELKQNIAFTARQKSLLTALKQAKGKKQIQDTITELLNGPL